MRDSHMHTPYCRHAVGEPHEYAISALEREHPLEGISFTCHCPPIEFPDGRRPGYNRMTHDDYPRYLDDVQKTARQFAGRLEVLLGLEVDFIPHQNAIDEMQALIQARPLDWVLGSVHPYGDYQACYVEGGKITRENWYEVQKTYFDHLAQAAETMMPDGSRMFDVITHPDLIKIFLPQEWNPAAIISDIVNPALARIASTGVAMELNTSGLIKVPFEMHPNLHILKAIVAHDIPVMFGSDAHSPSDVGRFFDRALLLGSVCGLKEVIVPIGGRRYETLSLEQVADRIGATLPKAD